jgi:uncharacterized membrane protein
MFDVPLHKLIIHFPIALAIIAFLFDAWALYAKKPELHDTGYSLSLLAAIGAVLAVVTGLQLADLSSALRGAVTGHALFGVSTALVLTVFAIWRYAAHNRQEGPDENYTFVWLMLEGLGAVLVAITAVMGHRLGL